MKKTMLNMIFVGLLSILILPFMVNAKSISTIEATETNGKIKVSGKTESGVLAIAALVYSGDDLVYMETCEATGESYSCILNNNFAKGDYIVKVADYDGGDYIVDKITISNSNPKTGDKIMTSVLAGSISLISLFGVLLITKKNKSLENNN